MTSYNCRICKSKFKEEVEQVISEGKGFREAAKQFLNYFDCDLHLLEQSISTHIKRHQNISRKSSDLTGEDLELIGKFRKGNLSFNEMQRELAARAFEKILRNPESVHVRDWLQSEMVKIKKSELSERTAALEHFVGRLFGGYLPDKCSNCNHPLWEKPQTIATI